MQVSQTSSLEGHSFWDTDLFFKQMKQSNVQHNFRFLSLVIFCCCLDLQVMCKETKEEGRNGCGACPSLLLHRHVKSSDAYCSQQRNE